MAYSYGQLESLWIQAGGSKALAPLMAAIALAESSGNPNAENRTDNGGTQTSWGLWQISDGTHSMPVPDILNPLVNAQQAVAKYKSQGLRAWGTYTSGAYRRFYQSGVSPSSLPQGGSGGGASAQDAGLFGAIRNAGAQIGKLYNAAVEFVKIAAWFTQPLNDLRIFAGIMGGIFVIGGMVM